MQKKHYIILSLLSIGVFLTAWGISFEVTRYNNKETSQPAIMPEEEQLGRGTGTIGALPTFKVSDNRIVARDTDLPLTIQNASVTQNIAFYGEIQPDGATCSNGQILKKTGANNWDCAADTGGGGSGGTVEGLDILLINATDTVSTDRTIAFGSNMYGVDGGGNSTYTFNVSSTPNFTKVTVTNLSSTKISGTWEGSTIDVSDYTNLAVSGTLLDLTGDTLSVNEGTLTDTKGCIYSSSTGLVCNSTFLTGNETITLSGDVSGSGTTAITTTIEANSVALGTDTTGNYLATLADNASSTVVVYSSGSESAAVKLDVVNVADKDFGDITVSSGAWTIDANSIALGTDTTGNYTQSIADAGNSTVSVSNGSGEGVDTTLDVIDVNCANCLNETEIEDIYVLNTGDTVAGQLTVTNLSTTAMSSVGTVQAGTWQGSVISSTYLDTAVILSSEIDAFSELDAIVADKTLLNLEDNFSITGTWDFPIATIDNLSTSAITLGGILSCSEALETDAGGNIVCGTDATGGGGGGSIEGFDIVVTNATDTISSERVLTGTSNQITVTDNGGNSTVVLSTPQDLHTSALVQFAQSTVTNSSTTVQAYIENLELGTPLSIAYGGTGASLTDPNADKFLFWDDSAGAVDWGNVSTGLSINASGDVKVAGLSFLEFSNGDYGEITVTNGSVSIDDGLSIAMLTASTTADFEIQGGDLFMPNNTSGHALIADGESFKSVSISGDIVIAANGTATIQSNSVALGTDTTGNYLSTIATGASSTLSFSGSGAESAAITAEIAENGIIESLLKSVNAPTDEQCFTYEATGGDFEWQACGAGSGDITDVFSCSTGDCSSITVAATDLLDFSGSDASTATEGIILPQHATACAGGTAEGQLCWEADADILHIGDSSGLKDFVSTSAFSGDATVSTTGVVTVVDDSHNHVITNIDAFTKANLETQLSDVADICEADGDVFTGAHDFGGATSIEIVNGAAPTVNATGEIALDTSASQLVYYDGSAVVTLTDEDTKCGVIENLAAADDNFEIWFSNMTSTITAVSAHCRGTCTTPAQISFEDRAGNVMTHNTLTAHQGTGNAPFVSVTAGGGLGAGEGLAFDVDNAVSPETDTYSICFAVTTDRQ